MSNAAGTLETIALELSRVLQPLEEELQPGRARILLAHLGITISVSQEASIASSLNTTASKITPLIQKTQELITAIASENNAEIFSKSTALIGIIKEIIESFINIKNALSGIGIPAADANKVPERLLNYLLVRYADNLPGFKGVLEFLGIIAGVEQNVGSTDPDHPPFTLYSLHFEKIGAWLGNGGNQMKTLYGWGTPTFDGKQLFAKTEKILADAGLPVIYDDVAPDPKLDLVLVEVVPKTDVNPRGLLITSKSTFSSGLQQFAQDDWKVETKVDVNLPVATSILLQPNGQITITPPNGTGDVKGELMLKWTGKRTDGEPFILVGKAGSSRFEIGEFILLVNTKLAWNAAEHKANGKFALEGSLNQCKILIDASGGDGFLKNILPNTKFEADFDLTLGVSSEAGFYFGGSSALEIHLPTHIALGPIALEGLAIGLRPKDGNLPVSLGADLKANLGPIVAVVQNMGVTTIFSFPANRDGNLGPVQLDLAFKPPVGIGLSLDAGVVKGGGYLMIDVDKGQYAGALELSIQNTIQVAAICVITTRMPDGSDGFSLLIIISATFSPGIALGMGFFLSGLGGMLGIHRTINVDALREGVRTNAIDNILFPEDVVNNIIPIINQITTIFPPKRDQFMIGLMARITWGFPPLITIDFGLAVEFASPVRIAILGMLKIVLPTEEASVMQFQVSFVGIIDFEQGMLSFDASLFNSRILTFTLEGDMALRLAWGESKGFLMSIGGFHPTFKPPAELRVPVLRRLTVNILTGNPRLVLTCYFALTSNTVQFGAKLDLLFKVSEFKVVGYLYFDVLFQFSPFRFIANIGAGLEVKMGNTTLFSITLDFELSGPTPWHAKGTASFSILFFTIKVRFDAEWGDKQSIEDPFIAILPQALEAFSLDANWTTELPVNRSAMVTLKEIEAETGKVVLQPFGSFRISQTIVPLLQKLEKFGNNKPADISQVEVKEVRIGTLVVNKEYVTDAFAPAMFKKMEDKDKLSAPSYEQMKSGIRVTETNQIFVNARANRKVEYEVKVSDFDPTPKPAPITFDMSLLRRMTKGGEIGKCALSKEYAFNKIKQKAATVNVGDESFVIVDKANMSKVAHDTFDTGSFTEATDVLQSYLQGHPEAKGKVKVVPAYHLEMV